MDAHHSLLGELEEAIQSGSRDKRIDTLRRITDLFLLAPEHLNSEQIAVFDDVLTHLVERVETRARAELAKRLAPVDQAPNEVIQRLAHDDEIAVAGPVLMQSKQLSTGDLVAVAQEKSQAHLLAIAGRKQVDAQVTDVLVDRGDRDVVHTLAGNSGAAFSQSGYSKIVRRAQQDESLTEKLGKRLDISVQMFRELLLRATEAVRTRLLASVSADKQDVIRHVIAEASGEISREAPAARSIEDAQRLIQMMQETGRLTESEILNFARHGKQEEVLSGLAAMCAVPYELIDRLVHSGRIDALLVPCKAAGLGWATVRAILELNAMRLGGSETDIDAAASEFGKLSKQTAARVLRFWQVRQTTQAQPPE
jgi:uncharacterized protein (DUF2336 family)